MKKLLRIILVCFVCGIITMPQIYATESNTEQRNRSSSGRGSSRGGSRNGSNGSTNQNRPSSGSTNQGNRPSNGSSNQGNRPGSGSSNQNRPSSGSTNQGNRPSNGGSSQNRPGSGNSNQGNRPGTNTSGSQNRPNNGNQGNRPPQGQNRPSQGPSRPNPVVNRPPQRPYRPAPRPYYRPTPPPAYNPHYYISPLQNIIGVAIGTALDASINYLLSQNYTIDGYADDYLYLRDVTAFNCYWPDVMLCYSNGLLASSQFSYSTSYYDASRYNSVYNNFYGLYGAPAIVQTITNGKRVSWWGYDNNYVTLEYQAIYNSSSGTRYYTTVIVGR